MKNNKIYSLISLCARARRLCSGNFSVEKAVKNQSAYVVIVAKDASDNTKKLFDQKCNYYGIPYYEYGTKDELGKYSGNEMRTSIAIPRARDFQTALPRAKRASPRRRR